MIEMCDRVIYSGLLYIICKSLFCCNSHGHHFIITPANQQHWALVSDRKEKGGRGRGRRGEEGKEGKRGEEGERGKRGEGGRGGKWRPSRKVG